MRGSSCVLMSVLLLIADGLIVKGPSGPLVAPLGSSVVLPCSVDELLSVKDLEVEWRRTDSETLVHLYQDGESRIESQQQDYQDRAYFFTDQIQHGNFSLRLDDLRAEDEGQYKCKVYIQQESSETVVEIKVNAERLRVSGSDQHISASVGEDVTLNCSVDSHIPPGDFEEVSWKKTDEGIQVLLYQDNEAHSSNERYIDRVELFPAEIPKGNFSLRLKSIRTEDKGVYMCEVFAGGLSANATVVLERLGFSVVHIMMLILCISASGSALLLFYLIYCRSPTKGLIVENSNFDVLLGSWVVLPCHVPPHLLTEDLKVEWRRTTRNSDTLVHQYPDSESRTDEEQQDNQKRAHLFTDQIQHGNFSLRLDDLRAEDAGEYTCTVHSKRDCVFSAKTKLVLKFFINGNVVPLGGSVDLPCRVDESLLENSLKVEWRRADSQTLVHLYQDGKIRAEEQRHDYHKRAHFLKKKIKDGNFSLRLKKLRAGDEGVYRCIVYKDQDCVFSADAELILGFIVKHSHHTPAPLGSSVILPICWYADDLSSVEDLEVEWRRTDSETLVHLYQDGESRAEAQQQDYQDRAHFFTDQIQHGNFSLRLDDLRAEDEGQYKCTVYSSFFWNGMFSTNIHLVLKLLDTVFRLQMFLVFCPNVLMFLAFVLWGVSEGSLFESVSCCALYFLRPLLLLWTAPYINNFTGNIKTWVQYYSYVTEYIVFSAVFYSVLFKSAVDKSLNYAGFEGVMIIILFVIVILFTLFYIIFLLTDFTGKLSERISTIFNVLAGISFDVLPSLQFILLFYSFGSAKGGFIIVAVLPVFTTVTRYNWDALCGQQMGCSPAVRRSVWLTLMMLINAVLVYFYITALENEKDRVGWTCVIVFLQSLWALVNFTGSFTFDLPSVVAVYVFGSVGVVLLNSVALMTELILKTVNGEGATGDMRIIVFSSELLFILILMILLVFEPWITPCLQSCSKAMKSRRAAAAGSQNQESQNAAADSATGSNQNQNPAESHEMKPLLNTQNQENSRSAGTEETQPDSVVSQ
ncbi:polymeric immunoglobulin receptor-like isoform X1 [Cyprinus carpio]|uniref:polymeric immunoglobulin receptor-like isoform X1 n=1 Tax=Cyprinus carpio TaxID=7962 RepID=UPI001C5958DE|nr:polymeric immunoglobulin receptor-like isoform X1 [Cyprinus carpio]